jgi:phage shock protein A
MTRFAAAPLTLIVFSLGLVACGGGDGGGGGAPSKAAFASNASKICKSAEDKLKDVGQDANTPDEIAAAVDKVIAETQDSVDKLKSLKRPEGDAGKAAQEFVDALQSDVEDKGIPALEDLRDALKKNDEQAARKAAESIKSLENTNSDDLARALGAKACAS